MDDVERRTGDARELDRAVRRLALELGRARQRVVVRRSVSGRQRLLDEDVDRVAVLGVHHHERTVSAATSIVLKSVSSSTMSAPL